MPAEVPNHTAVRVALWRALHALVDPPPHVHDDRLGLALVAPSDDWRARGDMDPARMSRSRASIVARARFVEDELEARLGQGVDQYVLLGAGLDTFALRRTDLALRVRVFEVDHPDTVAWKRGRLAELGYGVPAHLRLVSVDFEAGDEWLDPLAHAGFDRSRPAVVGSLGVAMYLSREANLATLRQVMSLATGTTIVLSFLLPFDLLDPEERPGLEAAARNAAARGTPFLGFFTPDEAVALAHEAGFREVRHVPAAELGARYFAGRTDGLRPGSGEDLLVATV